MIWLLFKNARAVIKAEALLSGNGVSTKTIAAPAEISSSCGMVLVVEKSLRDRCHQILTDNQIKYTIYER